LNNFASAEFSQIPRESIQWRDVITLAQHNQIVPLVYTKLANCGTDIPAEVLQTLAAETNAIVGWNLKLAGELLSLLSLLHANGIKAVPFKGPPLVCGLYGGLKLRQCRDLDIFVDHAQLSDTVRLLETVGYQLDFLYQDVVGSDNPAGHHKDVLLVNPVNRVNLDIHWASCEPDFDKDLSASDFWSFGTTIPMLGEPVPIPKPENLLVLLVIHGSRHHWNSLKLLCDIARLLTVNPNLDLGEVAGKLPGLWKTRMLLIPLALANSLWNVPLPSWVLKLIKSDDTVREQATAITERLFAVATDNPSALKKAAATLISQQSLQLSSSSAADRLRTLAQVLKRLVFPNKVDKQFSKLPARWMPLYFLIRPVRLIKTYGLDLCLVATRKLWRAILG
jgi:hypothetical protein